MDSTLTEQQVWLCFALELPPNTVSRLLLVGSCVIAMCQQSGRIPKADQSFVIVPKETQHWNIMDAANEWGKNVHRMAENLEGSFVLAWQLEKQSSVVISHKQHHFTYTLLVSSQA